MSDETSGNYGWATCGHVFYFPKGVVIPGEVKCGVHDKTVGIWASSDKPRSPALSNAAPMEPIP